MKICGKRISYIAISSMVLLTLQSVNTPPVFSSGWSHWENLGGVLNSGPTVASHNANRLDVFMRGTDDALWHMSWDGRRWGKWESLGGTLNSDPDCVSWGPNRIDCFARGTDDALWHIFWEGGGWSEWENLGGHLTSGPSAASSRKYAKPYSPNRLDVLARGAGDAMQHIALDGDAWSGWENFGGTFSSDPDCVSWSLGRVDCFARGIDGALWYKYWGGSGWSAWGRLGGNPNSGPGVSSWGVNRLDVFVRGTDDAMWHMTWNGTTWGEWENVGGVLNSDPDCVSWGDGRIDCFARGADDALWHAYWPATPPTAPDLTMPPLFQLPMTSPPIVETTPTPTIPPTPSPTPRPNKPPTASAGADMTCQAGEVVQFSGATSQDPDSDTLTYEWDFGDGKKGEGMLVSHQYINPGRYVASLTVSDGLLSSTTQVTVTVSEKPRLGQGEIILGSVTLGILVLFFIVGAWHRRGRKRKSQ